MADLIDRMRTLILLGAEREVHAAHNTQHDIAVCAGISEAMRIIKRAPTVDAAPVVHARWIEHVTYHQYEDDCDEVHSVECPVCGYKTWEYDYDDAPKYCAGCGARMDTDAPERGGEDLHG